MTARACAYCGSTASSLEKEHVVPRGLYRALRASSKVQRITVPACSQCNRGWSAAEPHFRSVLLIAGEPNRHVNDLWRGPTERSFRQSDGRKRLLDLARQMVPVSTPEGPRHKVYPERDPQVMLVIRKIVRGLSYYHGLPAPVPDDQVKAEVLKVDIPASVLDAMIYEHREPEIFDYWYLPRPSEEMHSFWVLRFFERRLFVARVEEPLPSAEGAA